jgi:hypothetical protein
MYIRGGHVQRKPQKHQICVVPTGLGLIEEAPGIASF